MTVYIDELFLLNLVINYLLLLSCGALCGARISRPRLILGAGAGALYACLVFFPELKLLYTLTVKTVFSLLMSLIAYGFHDLRGFVRRTAVFYVVSFVFAGAMLALFKLSPGAGIVRNGIVYSGISSGVLIAVSIGAYIILSLLLKNAPRLSQRAPPGVRICLRVGGNTVELEAMADTGNRLRDPLSNAPVLVAEYERVREALPRETRCLLDVLGVGDAAATLRMLAAAGRGEGFRLLPFRALGTEHGLLLALRPDGISADGKTLPGALLALTESNLSETTGCGAMIGA